MEEMDSEGTHVCNVNCTLIPSERAFFSLCAGPLAALVHLINERPGIPAGRIVEVIDSFLGCFD
jgi:hypothetical protein